MARFRDGQWVKWLGNVPGAHKSKDNKLVGIYHKARSDGIGGELPERVVPVSQDLGRPLFVGEGLTYLQLFPDQCMGLEAITDREDIPAERLKGRPTWTPRR